MMVTTRLGGLAGRCVMLAACLAGSVVADAQTAGASAWPLQVWMHVPSAPVAFPSEGRQHLFYELYVTNVASSKALLASVDIVDPDHDAAGPLAHFAGKQLSDIARPLGRDVNADEAGKPIAVGGGETFALFLEATLPMGQAIPRHLLQRLTYADGTVVTGGLVETGKGPVKLLGPPVTGSGWIAADGPSNSPDNHHRRGIFVVDGALTDSRRFAIDWKVMRGGASFSGDSTLASSYYALRQPVLAVADAVVVDARDGAADNPPGHNEHFHPAVPVTFDNAGGNMITLDLGDGQYAHYYHLEQGSIAVRKGDRVRRGQVIAKIGASGDAREPHLHLEVTNAIPPLAGEGLPYVIDRFRVLDGGGYETGVRTRELPLEGMMIDFATSVR